VRLVNRAFTRRPLGKTVVVTHTAVNAENAAPNSNETAIPPNAPSPGQTRGGRGQAIPKIEGGFAAG
jgi:hypothetical protein